MKKKKKKSKFVDFCNFAWNWNYVCPPPLLFKSLPYLQSYFFFMSNFFLDVCFLSCVPVILSMYFLCRLVWSRFSQNFPQTMQLSTWIEQRGKSPPGQWPNCEVAVERIIFLLRAGVRERRKKKKGVKQRNVTKNI